ncbi:MAG: low molecular weight protein-tyrosine-phosphatase [Flavobacteriales bacterium]
MKVLMVCLGNICRSPMAEGVLRHVAQEANFPIEVDSCGTSRFHVGENPDKRATACLIKKGISIEHLQARQFSTNDFDQFDYIYVMDKTNLEDIQKLAETEEQRKKVCLWMNAVERTNESVPDPYYGGEEEFEHVYRMLSTNAKKLVESWINKGL